VETDGWTVERGEELRAQRSAGRVLHACPATGPGFGCGCRLPSGERGCPGPCGVGDAVTVQLVRPPSIWILDATFSMAIYSFAAAAPVAAGRGSGCARQVPVAPKRRGTCCCFAALAKNKKIEQRPADLRGQIRGTESPSSLLHRRRAPVVPSNQSRQASRASRHGLGFFVSPSSSGQVRGGEVYRRARESGMISLRSPSPPAGRRVF